jgi:sugar phosphate isomerase/epimerase
MLPPLGLSTAAFYPTHLTEDALSASAQLGFRVVEIFLQVDQECTPEFGRELDRRRRELGVRVHSLHLYAVHFDMWAAYPRMVEETRARFLRVLEIANRLEACALTWHGLRYSLDDPPTVAAFFESVAWAGGKAQSAGVTLCIENVSWCYLRTPAHVRALLDAGFPVGFTFDTFQAGESEVDPAALIDAMGARLLTVHVADYAPGAPRHLLPGAGCLDWPAILRALRAAGYAGPLILEPAHVTDPSLLVRARTFLETLLA